MLPVSGRTRSRLNSAKAGTPELNPRSKFNLKKKCVELVNMDDYDSNSCGGQSLFKLKGQLVQKNMEDFDGFEKIEPGNIFASPGVIRNRREN